MTATIVKICGILTVTEGAAALAAGADWLGFVLWPGSKRFLSAEQAREVIAALRDRFAGWQAVGLFVDPTMNEVQHAATMCKLDRVQLSGNESRALVQAVELPVLKGLHVRAGHEARAAEIVETDALGAERYLLDTHAEGQFGGTGSRFDWPRLRSVGPRCMVAGGLRPDNVQDALRTLSPLGVDVSSGVEYPGGGKDARLIQSFLEAVRTHDRQLNAAH